MSSLTVTDLGEFDRYDPEGLPAGMPEEVAFTRRLSDGADWYGLIHGEKPAIAPADGVLYAVGFPLADGGYEVQAVVKQPDRLFPQGKSRLLRIEGYAGRDALDDLGRGKSRWTLGAKGLTINAA